MLIAARAHQFEIAHDEITKLFRISNDLLRRRITDFKATPAAQLTLSQFNSKDLNFEYDPPSYIQNVVNSVDSIQNIQIAIPALSSSSSNDLKHFKNEDLINDAAFTNVNEHEENDPNSGFNETNFQVSYSRNDKGRICFRTNVSDMNIDIPVPGQSGNR